jgi:cytochrome P450
VAANRDLELSDPVLARCPYPTFARLRADEPVCPIGLPDGRRGWFVTRYEDVGRILKDHRRFSSRSMLGEAELPDVSPAARSAMSLYADMMLGVDPPEHTRLRDLVRKAFTAQLTDSLRPYIERLANGLLDAVAQRAATSGERTMDLIADYAEPLPIAVILELLGIPPADREQMIRWGAVAAFDGSPAHAEQVAPDVADYLRYCERLLARKRHAPGNDLLSTLVRPAAGGEPLTGSELASMIFLLIFAGHETTTHSIGQSVIALLEQPAQLAALKADPSLIRSAVEELLRYDTPVCVPRMRLALEDVEIHGVAIARGDVVLPVLASANRDAARFPTADELDLTRTDNRHLTFGAGIHACVGAPLGRAELQIAIGTLLRRLPDLELAVAAGELNWRDGGRRRGVTALPLRF